MNRDSTGMAWLCDTCTTASQQLLPHAHTDSDMRQSLLVSDYSDEDDKQITQPPRAIKARIETSDFQPMDISPNNFFFDCFLCWRLFLEALNSMSVVPESWLPHPPLSPLQEQRLAKLEARVQDKYDVENPAHLERLVKIWTKSFPSQPFPEGVPPKSASWKDMGWQGEDPGTDVRGAGLLGLDSLVYLATQHPTTYDRLFNKSEGQRVEWEYPFAVAGLNVAFTLAEIVGIKASFGSKKNGSEPSALRSAAGRGFIRLLNESDFAFEEVFVVAFEELDREWLRQGASYMQFGQVLKALRGKLTDALAMKPNSILSFRSALEG